MHVEHPAPGVVRLRRALPEGVQPFATGALVDPPLEAPDAPDLDVRLDAERFTVVRHDGTPIVEGARVEARPGLHGEAHVLHWEPGPGERLYGWGEWALPLDRRGSRLVSWNTDAFRYRTGPASLYGTYPFLLSVREGRVHGLFWNDPHRTVLDLTGSGARLESDGGAFDLFLVSGPTAAEALAQYTAVTGRPPLWPRWSLGLHQSRWGYRTSDDVRAAARGYRTRGIPCDVFHLDIDHMRGYRVFTFDPERYADGPALVRELHDDGFRVVTIADPGIKADPEWDVAVDGLDAEAYVCEADGGPYVGRVWPGECWFPDFLDERARRWWRAQGARWLAETDVDGLWNDMNEPAVFPPGHDPAAASPREAFDTPTFPDEVIHRVDGQQLRHRSVHNLYGSWMGCASYDAFEEARGASLVERVAASVPVPVPVPVRPQRRPFVLTRSGFAGVQRHAWVWTGDNQASWEHLRLALEMTVSLGLSGVPFCGADVGGFTGTPGPELYVRFAQVGVLMPLMRIHSAHDEPAREPWTLPEPHASHLRAAIELRYRLLPHVYAAAEEAHRTGVPLLRPLWWEAPDDERLHDAPHAALLGRGLLAAPVLSEGATTVWTPLPPGRWRDLATGRVHEHEAELEAPLDRLPLLARCGGVLALGDERGLPSVLRVDLDVVDGPLEGTLYEDDGETSAHADGAYARVRLRGSGGPGRLVLEAAREGARALEGVRTVEIHGLASPPSEARVDGEVAAVSVGADGGVRLPVSAGFAQIELHAGS